MRQAKHRQSTQHEFCYPCQTSSSTRSDLRRSMDVLTGQSGIPLVLPNSAAVPCGDRLLHTSSPTLQGIRFWRVRACQTTVAASLPKVSYPGRDDYLVAMYPDSRTHQSSHQELMSASWWRVYLYARRWLRHLAPVSWDEWPLVITATV